jgi:hypothetical protein
MTILTAVQSPYPTLFDKAGLPLDAGFVYIGVAGANAIANPVQVYWDASGTMPVAQPIRTLAGYLSRDGAVASVFCPGDYSMVVQDKRGELVYSSLSVISATTRPDTDKIYPTLADLVADTSITAGQVLGTLGYYAKGDLGAALYEIKTLAAYGGTPNGFNDVVISAGLVAVQQQNNGVFILEQYGVGPGIESSARIQAANNNALAYNVDGSKSTTLSLQSSCNIKDAISLGNETVKEFNIDFGRAGFTVVAGGNIRATNPAFTIKANRSEIKLTAMEANNLGAGYLLLSVLNSSIYDPIVYHHAGYGTKISKPAGNCTVFNPGGYQYSPDDVTLFNTPGVWTSDTFVVDAADFRVVGGQLGYGKRGLYLTSNAANVSFFSIHPFSGNPKIGEPGQLPLVQPVIIESDASSPCHFYGAYLDTGLVKDNTFRMHMYEPFNVTMAGRTDSLTPYYRVKPQDDASDDRALFNMAKVAPGFYLMDGTTADPDYTWITSNASTIYANAGTVFSGYHRLITLYMSTGGPAGKFDETFVHRGTEPVRWQFVTNQGVSATDDIQTVTVGGGRFMVTGGLTSSGLQGIGYEGGAGGTVNQATSRTTAVTLNTASGRINMVTAAGSPTEATFVFNNSLLQQGWGLMLTQYGGANEYLFTARIDLAGGKAYITFSTRGGGTATDSVAINFQLFRGALV